MIGRIVNYDFVKAFQKIQISKCAKFNDEFKRRAGQLNVWIISFQPFLFKWGKAFQGILAFLYCMIELIDYGLFAYRWREYSTL